MVYRLFLKRLTDVVFSIIAITFLSPLFLLVAIFLKLHQGQVFYTHTRVGLRGKPIKVRKFQTMVVGDDKQLNDLLDSSPRLKKQWERNFKLDDDPRVTELGKVLRDTKIDEIPQFLNVFLGEMSMVGPRPITQIEFDRYFINNSDITVYQSVRPGLTGLWQINQIDKLDYKERIKVELNYIKDISIFNDFRVLKRTAFLVTKKLIELGNR